MADNKENQETGFAQAPKTSADMPASKPMQFAKAPETSTDMPASKPIQNNPDLMKRLEAVLANYAQELGDLPKAEDSKTTEISSQTATTQQAEKERGGGQVMG